MTTMDTKPKVRPWYISLTAKWAEAEGFANLANGIRGVLASRHLPVHHLPVPKACWHSTIYALLTIEDKQRDGTLPGALALQFFARLRTAEPFLRRAAQVLPLSLQPQRLQVFDDGTTIQFEDHTGLEELRANLRPLIESEVRSVIDGYAATADLFADAHKSNGPRVFGSIARSASRWDGSNRRWLVDLPSLPPLQFRTLHFLVSDDALTNNHDDSNSLRLAPP